MSTCYAPVRRFTRPLRGFLPRLACVRHAASVRSEPGSNSPIINRSNFPSAPITHRIPRLTGHGSALKALRDPQSFFRGLAIQFSETDQERPSPTPHFRQLTATRRRTARRGARFLPLQTAARQGPSFRPSARPLRLQGSRCVANPSGPVNFRGWPSSNLRKSPQIPVCRGGFAPSSATGFRPTR